MHMTRSGAVATQEGLQEGRQWNKAFLEGTQQSERVHECKATECRCEAIFLPECILRRV